jgi:fructose-specific phosphotransferase system IIC component
MVVAGQIARGQRVFCSDRGQRGGCGKTFPLFLAGVLPRHTFNATLLWALLLKLLAGATIQAATETLRLPFSLEAVYGIVRRCRLGLVAMRSLLGRAHAAPVSRQTDPFLQTLEHLQQIFPQATNALAAYQRHFQQPFLG